MHVPETLGQDAKDEEVKDEQNPATPPNRAARAIIAASDDHHNLIQMPPPPPPATSPEAQYALQFLSTALSQRGPSAFPYAEDAKWLIRQHLVSLSDSFPSLHPKAAAFTHNDGCTAHLLQAEGTIPISYHGSIYNIPAVIWLLESYPRQPPAVFLSPTRDMVVKPHHPHVDRSGSVSVPYLQSWLFPSSNLVDLVRSLSHLFSQDPPLYTRPNPNPNPNHNLSPSPSSRPYSSSLSSSMSSVSPYGGRLPQPSPQFPLPTRPSDDPSEVYRRNATTKLVESLNADVANLRRSRETEMEALFSTQAVLRQRSKELARGVREMNDEREGLEQQLQLVMMNTDVLEGWVRENVGRQRKEVDVDDAFETLDVLSRQMVDCTAADLAIEDTIYGLDKAAQEGAIPFDTYLKSVRSLAREQFFHHALAAKVRASQVQAQVRSMAARAELYSS